MFRVPAPRTFTRLGASFDSLDLDPQDELLGREVDPISNDGSSTDQFLLEDALDLLFTDDSPSPAPEKGSAPAVATGESRALEKLRQRRESSELTGESRALAVLRKKEGAKVESAAGLSVAMDDAQTPSPPTGEARALAMLRRRRASEPNSSIDEDDAFHLCRANGSGVSQPRQRSSSNFESATSEHMKKRPSTSRSTRGNSSRQLRQVSANEGEKAKTIRRKSGGRGEEDKRSVRRTSSDGSKRTPTRSSSSGRIKVGDVLTKRDSMTPPRRSSSGDRHPRSSTDHGCQIHSSRRPSHGSSRDEGHRQRTLRVRSVSVPRQAHHRTSSKSPSRPKDEQRERLVVRSKSARLTDVASLHRRSSHGTLIRRRVIKRSESGDGRSSLSLRATRQSPSRSTGEASGHRRASSLYAEDDTTTKEVSKIVPSSTHRSNCHHTASSRSIALPDPGMTGSTYTSSHENGVRSSGQQKTTDTSSLKVVVQRAKSFDIGQGKPASILRSSIRGERSVQRTKSNTEHELSESVHASSSDQAPIRSSSRGKGKRDSERLLGKPTPLKSKTLEAHTGLLSSVVSSRPSAWGDSDDVSISSELSSQSQSKKYTMISKHSAKSCTPSSEVEYDSDWGDESSFASFGSSRSSRSSKCTLVSVSKLVAKSQCRQLQEDFDTQTNATTMFALPTGLQSQHSRTCSVDDESDAGLRRYSLGDAASLASLRENIRLTNFHRRHSSDGSAQKVEEAITGAPEASSGRHTSSGVRSTRLRSSSGHVRRTVHDRRPIPTGVCVA